MRFILPVLAAALMVGSFAHANELDNEAQVTNETKVLSRDLPQTLVIRTNQATGETQILHMNARLAADMSAVGMVAKSTAFQKADAAPAAGGELDQDSSQSSWHFGFNRGWGGYRGGWGGGWGGYGYGGGWGGGYAGFGYPYYGYGGYNFFYNPYYACNYGGWNYGYYRWNGGWF